MSTRSPSWGFTPRPPVPSPLCKHRRSFAAEEAQPCCSQTVLDVKQVPGSWRPRPAVPAATSRGRPFPFVVLPRQGESLQGLTVCPRFCLQH